MPEKILVSGASGLVGSSLVRFLVSRGHQVTKLVRKEPSSEDEIFWDARSFIDADLEDFSAVIHLSGENIASGLWTAAKKKKLWDSRILSTKALVKKICSVERKPKVFICASAIGYYGDRGDKILTEESAKGMGFFADLAENWEKEAELLKSAGVRVVNARFGIILSDKGGALKKMLPFFKLGLGGPLGDGSQYFSWVALEDVVGILNFALENEKINGPINVTAPNPVTNAEFTKLLAAELKRPAFFRVPKFVLHLILGEMADEALLSSTRAVPKKIIEAGYEFKQPQVKSCL